MKPILLIAVLMLAGCATVPTETPQQMVARSKAAYEHSYEYTSRHTPICTTSPNYSVTPIHSVVDPKTGYTHVEGGDMVKDGTTTTSCTTLAQYDAENGIVIQQTQARLLYDLKHQ